MIVAVAVFVGSACAVAITVTVWALRIAVGAVYRPFVIEPTAGLIDHETLALLDPLTVAVNC